MVVDDLMDLPIGAVEAIFGRPVTYTPVGGEPIDVTAHAVIGPLDNLDSPGVSSVENYLDFRERTLEDAGIDPQIGDLVTFEVRGGARSYEVSQPPRYPDHGTVHLVIGRRSA